MSATGGEKVEPGDLLTNQAQKWNHSKEHPQNGGLEPLSQQQLWPNMVVETISFR